MFESPYILKSLDEFPKIVQGNTLPRGYTILGPDVENLFKTISQDKLNNHKHLKGLKPNQQLK